MSAPGRRLGPLLAAAVLVLLVPGEAYGWGPGTHMYLGGEVLRHLGLLGPAAAALLFSRPRAFLYGMLAPDLLVAKDRAPEEGHSHRWTRVDELTRRAGHADGSGRAAAVLGYRAHLAADVVAHGVFLPRRLLLTASTRSIGHSYWEHRVEASLPDAFAEEAHGLVLEHADTPVEGLFRSVLTPTVFDFDTNRRIYGEMVRWSNHERWQLLFGHLVDRSRWGLDPGERRRSLSLSVALCMEAIREAAADGDDSPIRILDPTGREAMERAKGLRRSVLRSGRDRLDARWEPSEALRRAAERNFPLPSVRGPGDRRGLERLLAAVRDGETEGRGAAA